MKTFISVALPRALSSSVVVAMAVAFAGNAPGGTLPSLTGPSLMLHLKADVANVTLNGSNVSQWTDISGSGNHFVQSTAASQPLWVDNVLGGQPVLRFDGVGDWMSVIGNGLAGAQLPFSFFAVTTGTTDPFSLFDSAPAAQNTFRMFPGNAVEFWDGSPRLPLTLNPAGSVISIRGSQNGTGNRVMEVRAVSASADNSTSGTGNTGPVSFVGGGGRTPNIGTINQGGNGYFTGDLAELVIYNGALDDGQREDVENYLRAEYGLAFVPPIPVTPSAPGNYGQTVLAAGPVAYWRLETNEGTIAADTADAAGPPQLGPQDGAYQDMNPHDRGQPGPRPSDLVDGQPLLGFAADNHAADFQGNAGFGNDVVLAADDGSLDFSTGGAFSVEAWVKAPTGQENAGAVIAKGTGGGGETFAIDMVNNAFRFFAWDSTGSVASVVQTTVTADDTWQHIVATADVAAGEMKFYVNGEEAIPAAPSAPLTTLLANSHEVSIGARQLGSGGAYNLNFDGLIDEVALYDHALSGAEVEAHFGAAFVPEPSTLMPALVGFIGLAGVARKRRRA